MSQESKSSQESHLVSGARGNTVNPSTRSRQWCGTINHYTSEDLSQMSHLSTKSKLYIVGKEGKGPDATPHLQTYFQFKNQVRFSTLKKAAPRAHWEKAKGSAQDNLKYCSKEGDFETNIVKKWTLEEMKDMVRAEYKDVEWKPWQQDVIDLIAQDTSSRTIYWIFEAEGNTGKSFLTKYLVLESSAILCQGKSSDILHAVAKAVDAGVLPRLILFDVPRVSADFISFQAIESLKNGCAQSGKYEGTQICIPSPTIVCFANIPPPRHKLSRDRWQVYEIKNNMLFEKLG